MIDYTALLKKIPFRWRVQAFYPKDNPTSCQCVAYVDSRDVMALLDEVCGPDGWQSDYKQVKNSMYGGIAIRSESGEWVWKWDCGDETDIEGKKGEASDAFKRAAVKWGVGRFLYEMGLYKLGAAKGDRGPAFPTDSNGKRIWDLTKFINESNKLSQPSPTPPPKAEGKPVSDSKEEQEKAWRAWRAYLNKGLHPDRCKSSAEIQKVRADLEKRLGPDIWFMRTYHDGFETFGSLCAVHQSRVTRDEEWNSPEAVEAWIKSVLAADLQTLSKRVDEYTNQDRLQNEECRAAMHERAQQLGLQSIDDLIEEPA